MAKPMNAVLNGHLALSFLHSLGNLLCMLWWQQAASYLLRASPVGIQINIIRDPSAGLSLLSVVSYIPPSSLSPFSARHISGLTNLATPSDPQ